MLINCASDPHFLHSLTIIYYKVCSFDYFEGKSSLHYRVVCYMNVTDTVVDEDDAVAVTDPSRPNHLAHCFNSVALNDGVLFGIEAEVGQS